MPTYDFRCPAGHQFERFFPRISDSPREVPCPECNATAERMISGGAGLVFKGSGFYITDYGKDGKKDQRERSARKSSSGGASESAGSSSGSSSASGDSSGGASSGSGDSSGSASSGSTAGSGKSSGGSGSGSSTGGGSGASGGSTSGGGAA
ncbi:MAG TPA: FmdB family zinc ribbon protein [Gemmatimonadales bacterium]|nr:FmdB family zinc ribbon protein [Gemmatimonadales bacterium]